MPEPVTLWPATVWKVELVRGREPVDVRGTLSLTEDALVFDADDGATVTISFAETARVRRVLGSPILVISRLDPAAGEIAFYFAEPPPLHPPDPATLPLREATKRRPSQRRQQRHNSAYLTGHGTALKPTIKAWVTEVRSRVEQTRKGRGGA